LRRFPKAPRHLASRSLLNSSENILKYKKYLFEFRAWASGRRVGIDSRNSNLTDPRVMRSRLTYCLVNRPVIMRIDRFHVAIIRELPSILVAFAIVAMVSRLGIDFKISKTYPDYLFGYVAVHMILGILPILSLDLSFQEFSHWSRSRSRRSLYIIFQRSSVAIWVSH